MSIHHEPLTEISNMAGQTFKVGGRVRHSDGWAGTVTGIKDAGDIDLLLVEPDDMEELRGYDRERPLNTPIDGRSTYCAPRDSGKSMGNYTPIRE